MLMGFNYNRSTWISSTDNITCYEWHRFLYDSRDWLTRVLMAAFVTHVVSIWSILRACIASAARLCCSLLAVWLGHLPILVGVLCIQHIAVVRWFSVLWLFDLDWRHMLPLTVFPCEGLPEIGSVRDSIACSIPSNTSKRTVAKVRGPDFLSVWQWKM